MNISGPAKKDYQIHPVNNESVDEHLNTVNINIQIYIIVTVGERSVFYSITGKERNTAALTQCTLTSCTLKPVIIAF